MRYSLRKVVGLILWWTEGTKSRKDKRWKNAYSYPVEITNTDPQIIRLFLEFLRKDIKIDENKLKVQIQIHEGDNQEKLENFWSKAANIPKSRFNKTIIRPQGKKIGKSIGTCKTRYSDKKTYHKLKKQLEKILKDTGV